MILLVTLFLQTIITLDKPISNFQYSLKLDYEVKKVDEFYTETSSSFTPNGELIVLDIGNKKVKIYNREAKLLRSFGEEGNGPGEFAGPSTILAAKDIFCVKDVGGQSFYDYDFNLLYETNYYRTGNRSLELVRNQFVYRSENFLDYFTVTKIGGLSENIKLNVQLYNRNLPKNTKKYFTLPQKFKETKAGNIGRYAGDYVLEVRDNNYHLTHILKKKTDELYLDGKPRIKIVGEPSKKQKELLAKQMSKKLEQRISSVWRVLGDTKHGVIVRTTRGGINYKKLALDLISHNLQNYSELTFTFEDRITDARIKYGKLILDLKNDEIGPYVQVYDLVKVKN